MGHPLISDNAARETYVEYRQDTVGDGHLLNILRKACAGIGATLEIEPQFQYVGRITFKNGRSTYFRGNKFDINPHASCLTATDKTYTSYYLGQVGIAVPQGYAFFSDTLNPVLQTKRTIADGCAAAQRYGYPVIIKPNDMSQGTLVTRVNDDADLQAAAAAIFAHTNVAVVQPIYTGNDYRIVVLDDTVIAAYQRVPLTVTGDGVHSITELLQAKQDAFTKAGRGQIIRIDDPRMTAVLHSHAMTLDSVPPVSAHVRLLDNANLSTGGEAIDMTDALHPTYRDVALRAARTLNLRMAGVDFIAPDITAPAADYVVLEVNASPGLRNYGALGPLPYARVTAFYTEIVRQLEKQSV